MTTPLRWTRDGVLLAVRVAPRSSSDQFTGLHLGADGSVSLDVEVSAPPDKGKANAAVIELLAEAFRLPRSTLSIAAGETGRRKTVHVSGNPDWLAAKIETALKVMATED